MAIATVAGYDADDEAQGAAVVGDQHDPSPLISSRQTPADYCPSLPSLSPCTCFDDPRGPSIDCSGKNLDNAGMREITAKIPATTPIYSFQFGNNALLHLFYNHVLHSPPIFTEYYLNCLSIANNQITSIAKGVFDKGWPSLLELYLNENPRLATIEDDALPSETIISKVFY